MPSCAQSRRVVWHVVVIIRHHGRGGLRIVAQ
jgi:hypothetical protein